MRQLSSNRKAPSYRTARFFWLAVLGLIILFCSWGLKMSLVPPLRVESALAQTAPVFEQLKFPPNVTTDRIPEELEVGQAFYFKNCSTCHFAIPPAVFPTQTWEQILQDSSHYGVELKPILEPDLSLLRRYLRFSSRLLQEGDSTPYRFRQSRYFKILHPQVALPEPLTMQTCVTCHPKAADYNFRESIE